MNYCEQVLLYAQGELNAGEKQAFEKHLQTCEACQAEVKFLAKLDETMAPPAAPAHAVDKLFARTTRKKSAWARFKWGVTALAAASCAGVFLVTVSPSRSAFDAHDLVAYMSTCADDEYTSFAQELTDMEDYF